MNVLKQINKIKGVVSVSKSRNSFYHSVMQMTYKYRLENLMSVEAPLKYKPYH